MIQGGAIPPQQNFRYRAEPLLWTASKLWI